MAFTGISTARGGEATCNRLIGGDPARTTLAIGQFTAIPGDLLDFKEDLVTAGWQVLGSGDGLALYELSGVTGGNGAGVGGLYDVLTTYDTGAGGFNSAAGGGSWWLMQTPNDADVTRYFVFAVGDGAPSQLRWVTSLTAFTGGSALTRPSSVDEAMLIGNNSTQAGRYPGPSGSENKTHWVIGDKSEEYGFLFWTVRSGTTTSDVHFIMGYDQCIDVWEGTNPPTTIDPDPHYMIACAATGTGNSEAYFKALNEAEGPFNPTYDTNDRIEDFVGDIGAKVCAYLFGGETSPPVPAGHYSGVFHRLCDNDNGSMSRAAGFQLLAGYEGYPYQGTNAMPIGSGAGSTVWIKGRPRGRLIRQATPYAEAPQNTIIDGQSMLSWGYLAVAWHETLTWVR